MDPTRHNTDQRRYFEEARKQRMYPRSSRYLTRQARVLARFAGLEPGMRVLDMGCGMGRYTIPLADMGFRVEGLDLSPLLLERLRAAAAPRHDIPVHAMDVVDCPPAMHGAFDAVVGFFVLHHVHDLDPTMAAVAKLLRPGGRAAFVEPNPYDPLYYVQIAITPQQRWRGERGMLRMRPGLLEPAMARAGLAPVRTRRFGFFPPFVTERRLGERLEGVAERICPEPVRPFVLCGGTKP